MINLQSGAAWDNKKLAVCSELSVTASHVDSVSSRAVNETFDFAKYLQYSEILILVF